MPRNRKHAPRKRNNRKRNFRRRHNRRVKRGVGNFTHLGHNLTVPKTMLINQIYQLDGYIAGSTANTGFFDLPINQAYQSLNRSTNESALRRFTGASNANGQLISGSSLTVNSQDYAALAQIYSNSRVLHSKIAVTVTPQALSDALYLMVTPFPYQYNNTITGVSINNNVAQTQAPMCKSKQCVANVSSQSKNTLHYSIGVEKVFGVSKRNLMDDPNFTQPVTNVGLYNEAFWRICWQLNDGSSVNSQPIPFHIKLTLKTLFFGLIPDNIS